MTRPRPQGFTLLEVMIALSILAVGLVALSDVNGGAINMHAYARRATEATLLLRGKMLDMEELLHKDGFSDYSDEKHGTFEDEGAPDFAWRAEILKPDVKLDADQLLGLLGVPGSGSKGSSSSSAGGSGLSSALAAAGGLLGGQGSGGAGALAGGLAAAGPFAGIISGQAKTFVETLKKSVREVRITVSWRDGKNDLSISASQQIVILPESVGVAGQTPGTAPAQGPVGGPAGFPGLPPPGTPIALPKGPSGDGDSR